MSKFARLALAGAICGICTIASAGDSFQNIAVSARVSGVCKLSAPATLDITADPSSGAAAENTAAVQFQCTKNLPYTFSVSQGGTSGTITTGVGSLPGTLANADSSVTVPFTASWTQPAGTGAGFSTTVTTNVKVSIALADYQDKPAGTYTGTIKVNVNY